MLVQALRRLLADAITMEYQGVCPECLEVTTGHKFFYGARAVADKHVCPPNAPKRYRVRHSGDHVPDGITGYCVVAPGADHISVSWSDGVVTRYNNLDNLHEFGMEVIDYADFWNGKQPLP